MEELLKMTTSMQAIDQQGVTEVAFTISVSGLSDAIQRKALDEAKSAYVRTLLAEGLITSGKAASLLGLSRLDMIERMGEWGISLFDDSLDIDALSAEVARASVAIACDDPE